MAEAHDLTLGPIPDPYTIPLDEIDVSDGRIYEQNVHWGFFDRLRKEDPVHFHKDSEFGPYWSITKYNDIMAVDTNHQAFSSDPTIVIGDPIDDFNPPMFIAMDPPKHDVQRKASSPTVAPVNLAVLEKTVRERVANILDGLPVGETFNWVDLVSIELTTQMLAILFDFPFEDRRKLTFWSDVSTGGESAGSNLFTEEERQMHLTECVQCFTELWHERAGKEGGIDFISMLANNPETKDMVNDPMELMGNLMLLIVGGNDTTRNSISGGVVALNENPGEYQKLRDNPGVIPNMVSEIIRWQTPLAHMRRTTIQEAEVGGKTIKVGDKVVMWYVSGNRDDEVIPDPYSFRIDRENARRHISFGFGIHRCMGNRMAELQLKILWEEIMKRFHTIELVGDPVRVRSNFVLGFSELPVRLKAY